MGTRDVSPVWWLGYRVGVFIAALAGGMIGAMPVGTLGLVVPFYVIMPLALIVGGLVSGISAGWAANLLAPDRTRSILLPIVGVSVAAAPVAVVIAGIGLFVSRVLRVSTNLFSILLLSMAILAASASVAAWRFRRTNGRLKRDLLITLGLLGAAPVVVAGTVFATCSLIRCGP